MYLPGGFEVRPPEVPAESCPHCGLCLLHSPASSRGATSSRPHLCTDPCLPCALRTAHAAALPTTSPAAHEAQLQ